MDRRLLGGLALLVTLWGTGRTEAQEVPKIQDNSFLIEEAYNQEEGVIQHIQTFQYLKGGEWAYSFTQEWPVPAQTHQFSYTVPYLHLEDPEPGTGFGDVLLNYRYQAFLRGPVAFAPRASLVLPTGDHEEGLGSDAWGVQGNLPLSVELGERWVTHWNLGATYLPRAKGRDGARADTTAVNYGASIIYLAGSRFNLLTEFVGGRNEVVGAAGQVEREGWFFINPGMRFALDFESGLQIVPGLSFPIGIGPSAGDYGVFLYLSFEHPLWKPQVPVP